MSINDFLGTLFLGLFVVIMIRGLFESWFGETAPTTDADATSPPRRSTTLPSTSPEHHPSTFRTSISSYFSLPTNPHVHHTAVTLSQTRILLCRVLPPELVPLVLDAGGEDLLVRSSVKRADLVVYDDSERGRHGRGSNVASYWSGSRLQGKDWLYVASRKFPGKAVKAKKRETLFDEPTVEVDHDAGGQHHRRDVEKPPPEASSSSSRHADTDPTAQSPWRIKKISIDVTSSDQGWTSTPVPADADEYDQSYTWFEYAVAREDGTFIVCPEAIQRNARAKREPRKHTVDLDLSDELIQSIRPGDRLCLLAKAAFIGWQNRVHEATITVLYGF